MPDVMFDRDIFSKRLRLLRTERGLTKYCVSKETGLSTSTISWLEMARNAPSAYVIYQTARFFQVSADWLLGLTDEREEKQWN